MLNELIQAVKPTGVIGVVGVYVPEDPGASNDPANEGKLAFDYGTFFFKGKSMGTEQGNVKHYNAAWPQAGSRRCVRSGSRLCALPLDACEQRADQTVEGFTLRG